MTYLLNRYDISFRHFVHVEKGACIVMNTGKLNGLKQKRKIYIIYKTCSNYKNVFNYTVLLPRFFSEESII